MTPGQVGPSGTRGTGGGESTWSSRGQRQSVSGGGSRVTTWGSGSCSCFWTEFELQSFPSQEGHNHVSVSSSFSLLVVWVEVGLEDSSVGGRLPLRRLSWWSR